MNRKTGSGIAAVRCSYFIALFVCISLYAQEKPKAPPTPGPMLQQGTMELQTPDFHLVLVRSSQTVAALKPKSDPKFDFTPGDLLVERSQDEYFHLGDITLRLREGTSGDWKNYSTATHRVPVAPLDSPANTMLASADLAPTLPRDIPLQVTRTWVLNGG